MAETWAILSSDWLQVCELWSRFAAEIRGRAQLSEAEVAAVCSALEDWADPRVAVTPPGPGVKLGGWVRWCQGVEYPHCSRCGLAMDTTFLQLEEVSGDWWTQVT